MGKPTHLSTGPGSDCFPITPNDSTDILPCKAFWIGTAGNMKFITLNGQTRTVPVMAGLFPVGGYRVFSTDTTASSIFGIPL